MAVDKKKKSASYDACIKKHLSDGFKYSKAQKICSPSFTKKVKKGIGKLKQAAKNYPGGGRPRSRGKSKSNGKT